MSLPAQELEEKRKAEKEKIRKVAEEEIEEVRKKVEAEKKKLRQRNSSKTSNVSTGSKNRSQDVPDSVPYVRGC